MQDRLKLPLQFDAVRMQADLAALRADDWVRHYVQQNYEGTWTVLPLRSPAGATHPIKMIYADPTATEYVDTPLLLKCPYLQEVLGQFRCPLNSARLMKLTAGSIIKEHTDYDLAYEEGKARLHVPVHTNRDVDFRLNGTRAVMAEGECWYLRLSDPHSVANRGTTDRIHLVIDTVVDSWLHEVFRASCQE